MNKKYLGISIYTKFYLGRNKFMHIQNIPGPQFT
jgi:hypothetical protein